MAWVNIAYLLLKIANAIYTTIDRERLIQLGEDRNAQKALLLLSDNERAFRELDERIDRMTNDEVLAKLKNDGDLRD